MCTSCRPHQLKHALLAAPPTSQQALLRYLVGTWGPMHRAATLCVPAKEASVWWMFQLVQQPWLTQLPASLEGHAHPPPAIMLIPPHTEGKAMVNAGITVTMTAQVHREAAVVQLFLLVILASAHAQR